MVPDKAHDSDEDLVHLVTVDKNKVMFYADVDTQSCLKLISCITDAKKYAAGHNVTEECEEPMCVYVHMCSNRGGNIPCLVGDRHDVVVKNRYRDDLRGFRGQCGGLDSARRKETSHAYTFVHVDS